MDQEVLAECTYCLRVGRSRKLTPLYDTTKPSWIWLYCPDCLPGVKESMRDTGRSLGYGYEFPPFIRFGRMGEHIQNEDK